MEKKSIDRDFIRTRLEKMTKSSTIKWGRSKIMIVGEGRAGKSALANSLLGKTFAPTESTVGINEFSCRIGKFNGSEEERNQWNRYDKPDKELEMLVAKSLKAEYDLLQSENIVEEDTNSSLTNIGQPKEEIDEELVWKCIQNETLMSIKYLLSIFDFGGQSVFNVIHPFFMTSYGVYLVVFNMEWMEVEKEISNQREQCFSYLKFWLNSIIIHTQRSEGMLTPILLIGTRKDKIIDPSKHSKISRLLHKEFSNNIAITYIKQNHFGIGANGTTTLMFFPVDNTLSDKDPVIESIMNTIENCLDEADYPHIDIPISWIKVYDQLKLQSKSSISLSFMKEIVNHYLSYEELFHLLKFLHELGLIMWHQDEILSKQIILDPIEYFVTPATTIICRHIPSDEDETVHIKPIHSKCQKLYFDEWISLVQKGILSHRLLIALLQDFPHYEKIIILLMKYSLIVSLNPIDYQQLQKNQLQQSGGGGGGDELQMIMQNYKYVVPALLPLQQQSQENGITKVHNKKKLFQEKEKLYFIFTPTNMITEHLFTLSNCSKIGFLPSGLFERLLAKSVAWCIETSAYEIGSHRDDLMNWNYQDYHFDRSQAFLSYGNQFFILQLELEYNAISLIVDGPNKKWIYDRVLEQLQSMISECMDCLEVISGLSWKYSLNPVCLEDDYDEENENHDQEREEGKGLTDRKAKEEEESMKFKEKMMKNYLLKYESIDHCISNGKYLNCNIDGKVYQISSINLENNYQSWMKKKIALEKYDIFLSYRWGNSNNNNNDGHYSYHSFDSNLAKGIFDGLSGRLVDNPKRSIETFLDIQRLQEGRRFDADFAKALSNSLIFVPLVSSYALSRMLSHDPMKIDNVLAEWIIGLDCYARHENGSATDFSIRLQRIYPIFIGHHHDHGHNDDDGGNSGGMTNLFTESILEDLPKIIPIATIEMIEKNLNRPLLSIYQQITVYEVVNTLKKFLCINAHEIIHGTQFHNKLIPSCFVKLSKSLRNLLIEMNNNKQTMNQSIMIKQTSIVDGNDPKKIGGNLQIPVIDEFENLARMFLGERIEECQIISKFGKQLMEQNQPLVAYQFLLLYAQELTSSSQFSENLRKSLQEKMNQITLGEPDELNKSKDNQPRKGEKAIAEQEEEKEEDLSQLLSTLETIRLEAANYKREIHDWTTQFRVDHDGREPESTDKMVIRDKFASYKTISSKISQLEKKIEQISKKEQNSSLFERLQKKWEKIQQKEFLQDNWFYAKNLISFQDFFQFFLDSLNNKSIFQEELLSIASKFKENPSTIPTHLQTIQESLIKQEPVNEETNNANDPMSSPSLSRHRHRYYEAYAKLLEQQLTQLQQKLQEYQTNSTEIKEPKGKEANKKDTSDMDGDLIVKYQTLQQSLQTKDEEIQFLLEKLSKENLLRKKFKNELEDMKGSIRVYARCRPFLHYEIEKQAKRIIEINPENEYSFKIETSRGGQKEFEFDGFFREETSQEMIYQESISLIESFFDGFNVCIFAYGASGTGKTYTMTGNVSTAPGLIPRSIDTLFVHLQEQSKQRFEWKLSSYCIELYNDNLIDLYYKIENNQDNNNNNANNKKKNRSEEEPKLEIKVDAKKMVFLRNATIKEATSAEELLKLFENAMNYRTISATTLNPTSSRGHVILAILLDSYNPITKKSTVSKLSFIDLAGSERIGKTNATHNQLKESQHIGKSLSALGDVINALSEKQQFIPYRNNKLTQLMQDSLGGNGKTLMFVTFSPADSQVDETTSTLFFAAKMKKVINHATKQIYFGRSNGIGNGNDGGDGDDNKEKEEEILRLKEIIKKLRAGEEVEIEGEEGGAGKGEEVEGNEEEILDNQLDLDSK